MSINIDSIRSGDNYPSYRLAKPGDTVSGTIIEAPRQVTVTNDDGKTRDQIILAVEINRDLSTSHRKNKQPDGSVTIDPVNLDESKVWAVWVPLGSKMAKALVDAVKAAGATTIDQGASVKFTLTGYGEPSKPGWSAPGLYSAAYKAPVASLAASDLF